MRVDYISKLPPAMFEKVGPETTPDVIEEWEKLIKTEILPLIPDETGTTRHLFDGKLLEFGHWESWRQLYAKYNPLGITVAGPYKKWGEHSSPSFTAAVNSLEESERTVGTIPGIAVVVGINLTTSKHDPERLGMLQKVFEKPTLLSNQAGGYSCIQEVVVGAVVPNIDNAMVKSLCALRQFPHGPLELVERPLLDDLVKYAKVLTDYGLTCEQNYGALKEAVLPLDYNNLQKLNPKFYEKIEERLFEIENTEEYAIWSPIFLYDRH